MSRDTASMVCSFHGAVETAVGLGILGILTAGRDAADDRAAHAARLGTARSRGEAQGLQAVVDRLRAELRDAQDDVAHLRGVVADLELDNEILKELVVEAA